MQRKQRGAGPKKGKTIAESLLRQIQQAEDAKVVDIGSAVAASSAADEVRKQMPGDELLAELHPAHAPYAYAQVLVSLMAEHLTGFKEMKPFAKIISKAEDLYVPKGPPISPLTLSYFTCWSLFDACAGPADETIGTVVLEIGAAFGLPPDLLRLIRFMQDSRMGLYTHRGREGDLVLLEEFVTGAVYRAISPAGHRGKKGELWYARLLPPPVPGSSEHVVITTPYVVVQPGAGEWRAYFDRTLTEDAGKRIEDYERHMKYGPSRQYWHDFVFEAYVNHRTEVIYLAGLPDLPESRPHSAVNAWGF